MSGPDGTKCSRCGASLPADGSADLCPRCRLSDSRGAWSEDRSESPSSPGEAHHKPSLDSLIAAIGATGQQPADADAHHYILAAATMALREQEAGQALSDADIHYYRGIALAAQKKLEQAVGEFAAALRLQPDSAAAHSNLGCALRDQGKLEEAIAVHREAVRLEPAVAATHNGLAWALVVSPQRPRHDYEEGLRHAHRGVELLPNEAKVANTLALAEYRSSHWLESIAGSERSMALQSGGNANDWFLLAMAHRQKGDKDQACKWFDKAVARTKELGPENADSRRFWEEAAELLGQPGPDADGAEPSAAPAAEAPR